MVGMGPYHLLEVSTYTWELHTCPDQGYVERVLNSTVKEPGKSNILAL